MSGSCANGIDHFLKDLAHTVDFRFVREACRDFYVDWGRDAWDPLLMFNMVCRQFLYDLSDREVEEQATFNLVYKWFLGLSAEELPPDHTTLCRFRVRLGAEGFQKLWHPGFDHFGLQKPITQLSLFATASNYYNIIEGRFDSHEGKIHGLSHKQYYKSDCTCPGCLR
jgi:hypothetical protein